jgi:hypothetical protein
MKLSLSLELAEALRDRNQGALFTNAWRVGPPFYFESA